MTNRLPWLALALMAIAAPVSAQSGPRPAPRKRGAHGRNGLPSPPPVTIGKVERFLNWVERRAALCGQPRDGFGVHVGIENGPAFALGPSWRTSSPLGGALQLAVSGAASIAGDRRLTGNVGLPRLADRRLTVGLDVNATHLAQETLLRHRNDERTHRRRRHLRSINVARWRTPR